MRIFHILIYYWICDELGKKKSAMFNFSKGFKQQKVKLTQSNSEKNKELLFKATERCLKRP